MVYKYSSTAQKQRVTVPSDNGNRIIGTIRNGVFYKSGFKSRKHICRKHKAIGLDIGAFFHHIKPNASHIECKDKVEGVTYSITTHDFESHSIIDDLGTGRQLFTPLKFWTVTEQHPAIKQLGLWEG